jgi:membrane associated rhomboid family serine protease
MTPVVQRLIIANVAIYLLQSFMPEITELGAIQTDLFFLGYLWQPFTYMWLHSPYPSIGHILMNMLMLWMFGGILEQTWGSRRFLRFYLTCGVGAGAVILIWNVLTGETNLTLGASGAVYGVMMAFSLTWPDRTIYMIFPPMPLKAIYFIPFLFLLQILFGPSNVSHAGHLGGVLVAAFLMREQARQFIGFKGLRYRFHRYRMRNKLRAVRREEWDKQRRDRENGGDDDRPTFH